MAETPYPARYAKWKRNGFQNVRLEDSSRPASRLSRICMCCRSIPGHKECFDFGREIDAMSASARHGMGNSRSRDHSIRHRTTLRGRPHGSGENNILNKVVWMAVPGVVHMHDDRSTLSRKVAKYSPAPGKPCLTSTLQSQFLFGSRHVHTL
jgi:hypothetical protein